MNEGTHPWLRKRPINLTLALFRQEGRYYQQDGTLKPSSSIYRRVPKLKVGFTIDNAEKNDIYVGHSMNKVISFKREKFFPGSFQ